MRKIRYAVTVSLDGYIAGPNGEVDWITMDPEIDFAAIYGQYDTLLVGRRTFDEMVRVGDTTVPGMKTIVFSRTLQPRDYPDVTIIGAQQRETLHALKAAGGKDIWLFGGGALFRSLLQFRMVDTVELAVIPVLLGGGTPLLPHPAERAPLKLLSHKVSESGRLSLVYDVI
jgi:dihydrofolate reductase